MDILSTTSLIDNELIAWQSLISAAIGGLLVILGQYINERIKRSREKNQTIINLSNKLKELEQLLFNDLRELAMFKTHANYWWFCHKNQINDPNYDNRHYEEHLRSQKETRITEQRIGRSLASYFGLVYQYLSLNNENTEDIITELGNLRELTFKKSVEYSEDKSYDEVRNQLVENDENSLKNDYWESLNPVKSINEKIYTQSKISVNKYYSFL